MQPYYQRMSPAALSGEQLDQLLGLGWYRMHQDIFTTSHIQLDQVYRVHWLRYHIPAIIKRKSHQRLLKKAKDFTVNIQPYETPGDELLQLHAQYLRKVDFEAAASIHEGLFGEFPDDESIFKTMLIELRFGHELVAAGYFDLGNTTAASILHFFNPAYAYYSPGKLLILHTLQYLQSQNILFYYPGYVVAGNSKMDYKLFLGKAVAEYFNPLTVNWEKFHDQLLEYEPFPWQIKTEE
jgi:arginine-tRNA-protein transferase